MIPVKYGQHVMAPEIPGLTSWVIYPEANTTEGRIPQLQYIPLHIPDSPLPVLICPTPLSPAFTAISLRKKSPIESLPLAGLSYQSIHVIGGLPIYFYLHRAQHTFYALYNGDELTGEQLEFTKSYAFEHGCNVYEIKWEFKLCAVAKIAISRISAIV